MNVEVLITTCCYWRHGDVLTEIEKELKIIAEYDDQIEMLNKYFKD